MRLVPRRALLLGIANGWFVSACSLVSLDGLSDDGRGGLGASGGGAASSSTQSSGGMTGSGGAASAGGASVSSSSTGGVGASTSGLIGHWPLDDGSGDVASDVSGSGNDGVLVNAPTWIDHGMFGGALAFAGDNGRMEVPALSGAAFPTVGTLSLWFNGEFVNGEETDSRGIFDNWAGTRSHLYVRRGNNIPQLEVQVAMQPNDGGSYVFAVGLQVVSGQWHHVTIVWDCDLDHGTVYFDGVSHSEPISDPAWTPSDQLVRFGDSFVGVIDEVRLYNRALTAEEVQNL